MKTVKKYSMRQMFENNRFVLVFSLVVAALFWLTVLMTGNYTTERTIYNVPVKVDSGSNALTSIGLRAIEDEGIFVNVEVEGPRGIVGQLQPENISLSARLTGVTDAGTYELAPTTDSVAPDQDYEIIGFSPEKVKIQFDRVDRQAFSVEPIVNGLAIAPGYTEKATFASPDTVYIDGPASELEKIDSISVTAELSEPLERTYSETLPIVLYDSGGNVLDPEEMHVNIDRTEAQVTIQVLKTTNLPLEVDFINIPRGFPVEELRMRTRISQLDVMLAGPFDLIDKLTEIQLGFIDLKKVTLEQTIFPFDVPLPSPSEQFMQLDNVKSVVVEIGYEDLGSAVFNITDPYLINTPPDFDVTLLADTIYGVEFVGKKDIIDMMTSDDIVAEVDLSEREIVSGSYQIPVKISVPGRGLVWAVGDHSITIQAESKSEE